MDGWTDQQMYGLMDGCSDRWTDRQTGGWTDGWSNRQTDGATDGQTLMYRSEVIQKDAKGTFFLLPHPLYL